MTTVLLRATPAATYAPRTSAYLRPDLATRRACYGDARCRHLYGAVESCRDKAWASRGRARFRRRAHVWQDDGEGIRTAAADKRRLVGLFSSEDEFDLELATDAALDILERSERGFFLMVESNNHSRDVLHTLDRAVKMDRLIEEVAERMKGTDRDSLHRITLTT